MSWVGWLILLSPLIWITILVIWLKYTQYQIEKQYENRQDDE